MRSGIRLCCTSSHTQKLPTKLSILRFEQLWTLILNPSQVVTGVHLLPQQPCDAQVTDVTSAQQLLVDTLLGTDASLSTVICDALDNREA